MGLHRGAVWNYVGAHCGAALGRSAGLHVGSAGQHRYRARWVCASGLAGMEGDLWAWQEVGPGGRGKGGRVGGGVESRSAAMQCETSDLYEVKNASASPGGFWRLVVGGVGVGGRVPHLEDIDTIAGRPHQRILPERGGRHGGRELRCEPSVTRLRVVPRALLSARALVEASRVVLSIPSLPCVVTPIAHRTTLR